MPPRLDILDLHKQVADNVENVLESKKHDWKLPINRKCGHTYIEWNPHNIHFTKTELRKIQLHLYYPSQTQLFFLMRRTEPDSATTETRTLLQESSKACSTFQRFSPKPQSFKVTISDEIVSNKELSLDPMWLDSKPFLHIVDRDTHFRAARVIKGRSVDKIWYRFL